MGTAQELDHRCELVTGRDKSKKGWEEVGEGCTNPLQTLEAIAESAGPCQVTERGNHGEFTRFFAVCASKM